jgi:hypothetical protein
LERQKFINSDLGTRRARTLLNKTNTITSLGVEAKTLHITRSIQVLALVQQYSQKVDKNQYKQENKEIYPSNTRAASFYTNIAP